MSKKLVINWILSQRVRHALVGGGVLALLAPSGIVQAATAPAITIQPAAVTVSAGQKAVFSIGVTGTTPITYQWRKDGVNITGATASSYTIAVTTTALSGTKYQVYLKNSAGAITSKSALLTVTAATGTAPALTAQPASVAVNPGLTATFSVTATGTGPLAYQWKKNGTAVAGATASSYTTPATLITDNGASFQVSVTNGYGAVTSNSAQLTVNAPTGIAPAITAQPAAKSVTTGQTASFSVTASGTGPLAYQWKKNGSVLAGATASSYTTPATLLTDNGASFQVSVTNNYGAVTSNSALLTVANPAGTGSNPVSQTVTVPDAATFTVTAGGNVTYQWKKNGVNISGATSNTYTTPRTTLAETSATFTVQVGSTLSSPAVLTVTQPRAVYAGDPIAVPAKPLNILEYCTTWSAQGAFRVGYDEAMKNPLWSAACCYQLDTPLAFDNSRNFRADPRSSAGITDGDYSGTGFSRGHQTMLSDMGYRYGTSGANPTCYMTNIAPQMQDQNGGIWNALENAVTGSWSGTTWTTKGLVWNAGRLWVTTGPVFGPNPATISAKKIPVPVAFYKVMVKEVNGVPQALAVVIQHQPAPATGDSAKFVTSVERLEELTGLNLFPALPGTAPADFRTRVDVRGWGAPFESTTAPNVHMVEPSWNITASRGASLTFRGAATSSNSSVASTSWTFGDGTTAATATASHTYVSAGTYTVTYSAQDALGVNSSLSRTITVQ